MVGINMYVSMTGNSVCTDPYAIHLSLHPCGRSEAVPPISRLDDTAAHGVTNELAERAQSKIAHNPSAMGLGRLDGDAQGACHLLVAFALRQKPQHFALTPGERPPNFRLLG